MTGTLTNIHYIVGTSTPYNCPAGSYMDMEGSADPNCIPCPGGKYCGEGDADGGKDCSAGFYCKSGNSAPNPEFVLHPCPMC